MKSDRTVAIVGMGGVFPGAVDFEEFWANVVHGHSAAREAPEGRWTISPEQAFDPEMGAADKVYSKRACFVDPLPHTATAGLDISPDVISALDPACRLLLHAGAQAFNDARTPTPTLDRSRASVIVGNLALPTDSATAIGREYLGRSLEEKVLGQSRIGDTSSAHPLNRYVTGLPAGALAKALGLGGGAYTLDAACASSLYAIKLAVDELLSETSDLVLAGGLSRPDSLYTQMGFSQLRALSPTGSCAPFDQKADGLVVGEGAGVVALKRTEDAVRDGDRIYAVIRGIGLSNDLGGSLLAPMSEGQLRAMRAAYEHAGLEPQDIDLIECHATGTPVGDAVEMESLRSLWGPEGWDPGQCVIGSVKSNVGHLLTAAGSVALIKTLLALKEETLPPTANYQTPASGLRLEEAPFRVLRSSAPWKRRDERTPRRAAVSAFGFGGVNAHLIIEEWLEPSPQETSVEIEAAPAEPKPIDVAVVGMEACFGPWKNLRAFQERALGGGGEVEPSAPPRWWGAQQAAWFRLQGLSHCPFQGYYMDQVEAPLNRFRIPPKELKELLPQQILMLEVAARALDDAGVDVEGAPPESQGEKSARRGVYVGIGLDLNTTNYDLRWSLEEKVEQWAQRLGLQLTPDEREDWLQSLRDAAGDPLTANRTMGGLGSIIASRIAREFFFGGPSFTLSSEESSSVRALEAASRALQSNELDLALVGGVDLAGDVRAVLSTHRARPFSTGACCRPFDEDADGTLVGEGAAAVVLKRLEDAERDGDRIYAVIKGIGAASGGGVDSVVPTESAYVRAVERAHAEAKTDPLDLRLLEAHGSGFPDEDLMEARALARLFKSPDESKCLLSSVKADIGHTGAASGIAGFVKTCLCLYQEVLPPLRNFAQFRAELAHGGHKLYAGRDAQYWLRNRADGPSLAAMSSFSVDGSCAHVVLESFDNANTMTVQTERLQPLGVRREGLFAVEANNAPALEVGLGRLQAHVERAPERPIEALAREWWRENREDMGKTLALSFVARNGGELLDQIEFMKHSLTQDPERALSGQSSPTIPPFVRDRVFFSPNPTGSSGKIAFVFPGSGNQYGGMGRDLSVQWPEVFRKQDAENQRARSQFQPDVFWNPSSLEAINRNHKATLFGQVALGSATSDLVQSLGIRPQAVIGYSLGETAGLFALKAWTDRDLMLQRINESTLFTEDLAGEYRAARKVWKVPSTKTVDWALGVIDRPAKVVRAALTDHKKVYSLIVNTLHECVVGGDPHAVEKLVRKLDCEFFPLHGVTTVHCEVAKEVQGPYRDLHLLPTSPPRDIRFYSGSWGTAYNLSEESAADSVLAQAIYGIDYPKVIEAAYKDGVRAFLEMGPGGSCSRMIGDILGDRPHVARSVCVQGNNTVSSVLRLLGQLIAERVSVDLSVLYGQETRVREHRLAEQKPRSLVVRTGGDPFHVVLPGAAETDREEAEAPPETPTPVQLAPEPLPSIPAMAAESPAFGMATLPATPSVHEPAAGAPGMTGAGVLLDQWKTMENSKAEAHASYLRFAEETTKSLAQAVSFQVSLLEKMAAQPGAEFSVAQEVAVAPTIPARPAPAAPAPPTMSPPAQAAPKPQALDRDMCTEFAIGSIAKALGPEYAPVDANPTRVRLPDEPLMLVDRILSFDGEPLALGSGRVVTEHDVTPGAWYLDGGRIPTCIAVEAGQADLILSAYLGIDFQTKGLAMYRLLDAEVTFHGPLPKAGETVHYDIRIERFFRQGETYLFRFNFDGTVDGRPLLTMRNGCAGFFTREELDAGVGLVRTEADGPPTQGTLPVDWRPPVPMAVESYTDEQVQALREGDLAACFGAAFAGLGLRNPVRLPKGRMQLVDRVIELDPTGGRYGIGRIRAEMDVQPDDWFLTCHFVDDMVMPGTLMYECCLHTLRIYLMRMGWVGEADQFVHEPIEGACSRLQCRGEVNQLSRKVVYDVTIKELGFNPSPYAIADAVMHVDGKPSVEIAGMSIQLTGLDRRSVETLWSSDDATTVQPRETLYDSDSILAFATGNPSEAFGERYLPFDKERFIARLPGPPYMFLDRIVGADAEPWVMKPGGSVIAEYDVPPDAWYFASNRQAVMPFAVLLEVPLQVCGWFSSYMGSALHHDGPLHYRNLDGKAKLYREVTPDCGTLTTRVTCTNVSTTGGMIIQSFTFETRSGQDLVYAGDTTFGYFAPAALANQIGLRDAAPYRSTDAEICVNPPFEFPRETPYADDTWRMVDRVTVFDPKGGPHGLGFVRGEIDVDPSAWFFDAHFYQDPVWPGSLGLEGFVQLLRMAAVERWSVNDRPHLQELTLGVEHEWTYRGQIVPKDKHVTIEAAVTRIDDDSQTLYADGYLSVDGRVIYGMKNFTVTLNGAGAR